MVVRNEQAIGWVVVAVIVGAILYHTWTYIVIFLALVGAYHLWNENKKK